MNHLDSIFPDEFEYSSKTHKMYIDKKSHHIVFYKVITPKKKDLLTAITKCNTAITKIIQIQYGNNIQI